jgi:hypothetical protein
MRSGRRARRRRSSATTYGAAGAEDEFKACFTESWEWDGSGVIFIPEGGEACDDDEDNPDLFITVKRVMLLSSAP